MDGIFKFVPKIIILLSLIPMGLAFLFFSDDPPPPNHANKTKLPAIFLQDWPMIKLSMMDDKTVMADCFEELPFMAINRLVTLRARNTLRRLGCPLRLPGNCMIIMHNMKVKDEHSYAQIFSGETRSYLTHTSGKLYDADGYTFGPYEDPYVLFHFRPISMDDSVTFHLLSTL